MPLYLIPSVGDDGVDENSFRLVEAKSPSEIAQSMLDDSSKWEPQLRNTEFWWELSRYEDKYDEPLGWTAEELLHKIEATWADGGSRNELRILEINAIERLPSSEMNASRVANS